MYFTKEPEEVLQELNTTLEGLSTKEVASRLKYYGKNILPKGKRNNIIKIFLSQFTSLIELILIITVVISLFIGETIDALVITFIILVDVIMGTIQENKARKSAEALANMIKTQTKVIRNNEEIEINTEELVVGDIILLESGTKLTADARLIDSYNLQVDESILTGESTPVTKNITSLPEDTILAERKNMLYSGTSVMTGRAKAVVVATSINTEIGKIASVVAETKEEKSPLTIRMEKFSKQISIIILIVALISAFILLIKGYEIKAIFLSVVALAVSAMPEGLNLALTMALTIASNRMSKKNVIIKKLNSVESLGSCTVIASDKTGTLTVNEQTARKIVLEDGTEFDITGTGYNTNGSIIISSNKESLNKARHLAILCASNNEAHFEKKQEYYEYYGDSIDIAFLVLKEKMKVTSTIETISTIPYESEKGYSVLYYKENGQLRCTIKGALEKILAFSSQKDSYIKQNEELSKEGYRVIAVCDGKVLDTKEENIKNLEFLGQVAFIDPIREEVPNAIKECQKAQIKVLMITGDHPLTAFRIAKDLSLVSNYNEVVTGKEIKESYQKGNDYFDNFIKNKKVFSRVTPTDKLNIVNSLKRMGEFVAVTGDGVNDAPAIKTASIGIAMGSGTDVAKDTASMIIIDNNFNSIVSGIKEGRVAYANIRKIILFLLSCGMAEVLFYLLSIGFGYEVPLIAIQLLWINVVTDGLQDMALSFEKETNDIMKEKPRDTKENIFNKELMSEILIYGLSISLMIFLTWKYLIDNNTELLLARSIVMMLMVFIQNIHVLNCRSEKNSIFKTNVLNNPLIIITIISSVILELIVTEIPSLAKLLSIKSLHIKTIIIIFLISIIIVLVAEIYKLIYRTINKKYNMSN